MGDVEKPTVAEAFNRTWQFFPRQVAEEKKESDRCATDLITCPNFSWMTWRDFNFLIFRSDWWAKTFIFRRKVWRERFDTSICGFRLSCPIWYRLYFICVIIVTPVTIECFCYQCESIRNSRLSKTATGAMAWCTLTLSLCHQFLSLSATSAKLEKKSLYATNF